MNIAAFFQNKVKKTADRLSFYAKTEIIRQFSHRFDSPKKSFAALRAHRPQKSRRRADLRICCTVSADMVKYPFWRTAEQRCGVTEARRARAFFLGAYGEQPLLGEYQQ